MNQKNQKKKNIYLFIYEEDRVESKLICLDSDNIYIVENKNSIWFWNGLSIRT